jgi:hypothetical protein
LTEETTIALNIGIELRQVLKNTTARSLKENFGKRYALLKENPDGQIFRAFKHSLTTQWDILPQYQSMIKEYYEVKESQKGQFMGVRMNYHVWRRRFIDIVHSQPPEEPGSRSAIGWIKKRWPLESVKTIITVEDQKVMCTDNKDADHRAKLKNSCGFCVHKDTILAVTRHMLARDRQFRESKDYDGKPKPSRRRLMSRSISSNSGPVISNEHAATEQIDDTQMDNKPDMPCHEHSLCVRMRTQPPRSQRA